LKNFFAKTVPDSFRFSALDKRQNNAEKTVNFSVWPVIFSFCLSVWVIFEIGLCRLGFGADTDAWLMARSAALIRDGLGYDPARSLGNPLWEYLLVILQPSGQFFLSNIFSLVLALIFFFRFCEHVPAWPLWQRWVFRLLFCLLPVFSEAASSSMESMASLLLFSETLLAFRQDKTRLFVLLSLLLSFMRLEMFLFLMFTVLREHPRKWHLFLLPVVLMVPYLAWVAGKNPAPFYGIADGLHFYAGRIWFLIQQAGLLLPVYLVLLFFALKGSRESWGKAGQAASIFFLLFPFEWAYAFPAFFSGALSLVPLLEKGKVWWQLTILAFASLASIRVSEMSGLTGIYQCRRQMLRQYQWASSWKPAGESLIMDAATWLTLDYRNWESSKSKRLFHKKGTLLYTGERLSVAELDSLQNAGFHIFRFSRRSDELLKPY
jgi:hypothetical protein